MSLEQIRDRWAAATQGPWVWFGNTDVREIHLATPDRGRQFIMRFSRWGMQGAQPLFNSNMLMRAASEMPRYEVAPTALSRDDKRVYRADISGINHPDAEAIAQAPTDVASLLRAVDAVLELADRWQERGQHLIKFSAGAPYDVAERLSDDGHDFVHKAILIRDAVAAATDG